MRSASLLALTERFADALGLRAIVDGLYVGVVDKVLEILFDESLTPRFREALTALDEFRKDRARSSTPDLGQAARDFLDWIERRDDDRGSRAMDILGSLRPEIGKHLAGTVEKIALMVAGIMLGRGEIASYNEFSTQFGTEWVRNYWIPFSYPSELWEKIEEGEGPTFLSEVGSRLWRFSGLRNRVKRTEEALLAQGGTVDSLVGRSRSLSSPPRFFKSDEIVNWWFEKETVALRYYLVGVFSFPESF